MPSLKSNFAAGLIIAVAVALAIFSVRDESLTSDELSHIPAGYSYLTQKDMRINPEHPPLIKDLAALPLLFQNLKTDFTHPSWTKDVNGQWSFGANFMYETGNDADAIAFSSRIAAMLLFILLCWLVYKWGLEKYGSKAALLALTLTAFSPNMLAHARYVTTDVGAALGFVLALYFFVKFSNQPSKKNLVYAGLAFGLAQLLKFSLILLLPLYVFILAILYFVKPRPWSNPKGGVKHQVFDIKKSAVSLLAILTIGYLLVWPVYQFHVWNYPPERQKSDTEFILGSYPFKPAARAVVWLADKPILRPYAQYLLGLAMVFQRTGGGNTTYYLGDVSAVAWKSYFPVVYLIKEPLPILLLILAALGLMIGRSGSKIKIKKWIESHLAEFTWLAFIVLYWTTSIIGNLNIGLRHVLPTFPFIYLLVSGQIIKWLEAKSGVFEAGSKKFVLGALLAWLIFETAKIHPYYLAYFNQLAGGAENGYKYAVDSNLDWGQDLRRLAQYVEENKIDKIKLDYFGGGRPEYYLGDKYEYLRSGDTSQRRGWLAVSATFLQNGRGRATKGYNQGTTFYRWLDDYEPVAKIGYSIFVYKLD